MNKINLTLDNLVYNLAVNSSDDLAFVLPLKTPNVDLEAKAGENAFVSTTETTIKVYIRTKKTVPTNAVVFEAVEGQNVVVSGGKIQLLVDTLTSVTCSTTDGGRNWLVNSCNAASETAEGALAKANANTKSIENTNTKLNETNTALQNRIKAIEDKLAPLANINVLKDITKEQVDNTKKIPTIETNISKLESRVNALEPNDGPPPFNN